MEYEVEGPRPRGRPKRTWREVVREDCQARKLNKEDAVDRCKWREMIKDVRWSRWVWVGECFFWYRPTRVVPDKRPLNMCVRACCVRACVPGWASTRKVKPVWILLKQETESGSGISWAICKSASHSRQITMPVPHHSSFDLLNVLNVICKRATALRPLTSSTQHFVTSMMLVALMCKKIVVLWYI